MKKEIDNRKEKANKTEEKNGEKILYSGSQGFRRISFLIEKIFGKKEGKKEGKKWKYNMMKHKDKYDDKKLGIKHKK